MWRRGGGARSRLRRPRASGARASERISSRSAPVEFAREPGRQLPPHLPALLQAGRFGHGAAGARPSLGKARSGRVPHDVDAQRQPAFEARRLAVGEQGLDAAPGVERPCHEPVLDQGDPRLAAAASGGGQAFAGPIASSSPRSTPGAPPSCPVPEGWAAGGETASTKTISETSRGQRPGGRAKEISGQVRGAARRVQDGISSAAQAAPARPSRPRRLAAGAVLSVRNGPNGPNGIRSRRRGVQVRHHAMMAFWAWRRFSASSITTERGPSATAAETSLPR